ncbi:MAG: hypothetical protein LM590_08285 [Thermofilum sp.]|nr:hypothetical protein [Thermofilum sp.]
MGLGFIAVGWTRGLSSRRFTGRYKSLEELRDVLKLDRLTSSASRRLYSFKECEASEGCLWLLSFDIKFVKIKRSGRSSKPYRKPSHEYTFVKEMMYSRLCGPVDMSTYACFDDESFRVRGYLDLVAPGYYKLEVYHVRPHDDKARDLVRRALVEAVEELAGRAQQLALRLRSLRPNNRARAVAGALKLVEMLRSAVEVARTHRGKIEELGLAGIESKLTGALELLEGALSS